MNKPLVILLLLVIGSLLAYRFAVQDRSEPVAEARIELPKEERFRTAPDGVKTDEKPEFDVTVETRMEGRRPTLEFSITETHGWAVTMIYIRALHGTVDEETGEWEPTPGITAPPQMLAREILDFGKTLVVTTTLTNVETTQIGGDMGTAENWRADIYQWGDVYKPK